MKQSLKELFNIYINECQYVRRLRSETIRGYTEVFRHFLAMMPEIQEPHMLSREVMAEFFQRIQNRKRIVGRNIEKMGIKGSTIKTYWSKLNSFFIWLQQNSHIIENPLIKIKPPEPVYEDKRALSGEEIHKIISSITLNSYNVFIKKRDLVMVSILVFCGLRKNELVSLEVRDVDLEKRILTVRAETSKSKRTRQIPINPSLHMSITDYFEERKKHRYITQYLLVSSTQDKGLTHHGIISWVKKMNETSGVKFHLHRFRHTFACNLATQGATAVILQRLMGHTDLRMTERYLRSLTVEDMRDEVNKMSIDNLM